MKTRMIIEANIENNTFVVLGKNKKAINFFKQLKNKIIKQIKIFKKYAHNGIITEKFVIEFDIFTNEYKIIQDYFAFSDNQKKHIKQNLNGHNFIF